MAGETTLEITDATFERDVLGSDQPVLVDFWAGWCPPCVALAPTIDALAEEYAGRAAIGKLDVDTNPTTAQAYGVTSIPTVIVFFKGEEIARITGLERREAYVAPLDQALGAAAAG